jgi:hypothetical protein
MGYSAGLSSSRGRSPTSRSRGSRQRPGADRAKESVPPTHDLPALWAEAGLPALSRDDQRRLLIATSVLYWAGRYGTPRTAAVWQKENAAFDALSQPAGPSGLVITEPTKFGGSEFDSLYQVASAAVDAA